MSYYSGIQTITNTSLPKPRFNITAITGGHGAGKTRLAVSKALERFVLTGKQITLFCTNYDYESYNNALQCYDYQTDRSVHKIKNILHNFQNDIIIFGNELITMFDSLNFDIKDYFNTSSEYIIEVQRLEYLPLSLRNEISTIINITKGEIG